MTLAELRNHLLAHIGVDGVGEAPSAEDADITDTVITNCQGELDQLGIALWTTDDVPSWAVEGFTVYASPSLAVHFGKQDEFPLQLKAVGVRILRELVADRRTSVGTADYF